MSFLAQLVKCRVPDTNIVPIVTLRTFQSYLNHDFIYRLKPGSLLIEVFGLVFELHHDSFDLLLHTLTLEALLCLFFPTFQLLEVLFRDNFRRNCVEFCHIVLEQHFEEQLLVKRFQFCPEKIHILVSKV